MIVSRVQYKKNVCQFLEFLTAIFCCAVLIMWLLGSKIINSSFIFEKFVLYQGHKLK